MVCLASGMTPGPTTAIQTAHCKRHHGVHSDVDRVHSGDSAVQTQCVQRRDPRGIRATRADPSLTTRSHGCEKTAQRQVGGAHSRKTWHLGGNGCVGLTDGDNSDNSALRSLRMRVHAPRSRLTRGAKPDHATPSSGGAPAPLRNGCYCNVT